MPIFYVWLPSLKDLYLSHIMHAVIYDDVKNKMNGSLVSASTSYSSDKATIFSFISIYISN